MPKKKPLVANPKRTKHGKRMGALPGAVAGSQLWRDLKWAYRNCGRAEPQKNKGKEPSSGAMQLKKLAEEDWKSFMAMYEKYETRAKVPVVGRPGIDPEATKAQLSHDEQTAVCVELVERLIREYKPEAENGGE